MSLVGMAPTDSQRKSNQHLEQHAQEESAVERQFDLGVGPSDGAGRREPPPPRNWPDKNTNTAAPNAPTKLPA